MTDKTKRQLPAAAQDYARFWAEGAARVLEQLKAVPFACTPRADAAAGAAEENVPGKLFLQARVSGCLGGEQAFELSAADGLHFAQMLMAEPLDAASAFTPAYADALSEIFRQFAGLAAAACKARFSREAAFEWTSTIAPEWPAAAKSTWIFAAPQTPPLQWTLLMSPPLLAALEAASPGVSASEASRAPAMSVSSAPAAGAKSAANPPEQNTPAKVPGAQSSTEKYSASSDSPANLDLLLDVVLDASLRFGQREMLLRDILDLRPGSVIELNRNVQEPAELLVGGRVIARGDVVIVDGNYGLRITDIAKPRERLESIEAGE